MSRLHEDLADYLSVRRAMGYKLERAGKLLAQFVDYLDDAGVATVTVEHAVAWATLPVDGSVNWHAHRLSVVRGFASWLSTIDPSTEVPATDLLPARSHRATPYLYTDEQIAALLAATEILRGALRRATYHTLFGLLSVAGLRISEAIGLDRRDLDVRAGLLVVRSTKFGKDRHVPLHPTSTAALAGYLQLRDRQFPRSDTPAVLVSTAGTRLRYCNVHSTFRRLVARAGLERRQRSVACRPRIHDYADTGVMPTSTRSCWSAAVTAPGRSA